MIANSSILSQTALGTQLGAQSTINPKGKLWKRTITAELLLTSLIDAFSILVIFLLVNFSSTGEILSLDKDVELPKASLVDPIERNTVIKYTNGVYFLENEEVSQDQLVAKLLEKRQEWQAANPEQEFTGIITIQADRRTKFESLNSIVLAMANTGYSDIRFAVLIQ
ncbi:MAG: ExbD/TolR family protein [Bdellovibrionia bacterium]